jgi:hypothetical protein
VFQRPFISMVDTSSTFMAKTCSISLCFAHVLLARVSRDIHNTLFWYVVNPFRNLLDCWCAIDATRWFCLCFAPLT